MIANALHELRVKIRKRDVLPIEFPKNDCVWAIEVELGHAYRLFDILNASGDGVYSIVDGSNHTQNKAVTNTHAEACIIYADSNIVKEALLPGYCLKYISRMFYVPYLCRDICYHLPRHKSISELIYDKNTIFKIVANPKDLEEKIGLSIINLQSDSSHNCRFTKGEGYTHMLMCVYSKYEGLYRWGLVSRQVSMDEYIVFERLLQLRESQSTVDFHPTDPLESAPNSQEIISQPGGAVSCPGLLPPVCRAYFKLAEIFESYFPRWGWSWDSDSHLNIAVDIGASPGGWSQYLAAVVGCRTVLAVDPGELHPGLLSRYPNIQHIAAPVQDTLVQTCISSVLTLSSPVPVNYFIVCDMNCDARQSSELLCGHVLPHFLPLSRGRADSLSPPPAAAAAAPCAVYIVLTLKLHKHPKQANIDQAVRTAQGTFAALVGPVLGEGRCIHVHANSLNERMLICRYTV